MLDEFAAGHHYVMVARIRSCAILQHAAGGEFARWTLSPLLPESLLGQRWLPLPWWTGLRPRWCAAAALRAIVVRGARGAFTLAAEPDPDASPPGQRPGLAGLASPARRTRGDYTASVRCITSNATSSAVAWPSTNSAISSEHTVSEGTAATAVSSSASPASIGRSRRSTRPSV
jgi:hypothetical protein